jgi:hypothetical protein
MKMAPKRGTGHNVFKVDILNFNAHEKPGLKTKGKEIQFWLMNA